MKIALFVRDTGDTNLALETAKYLRQQGHQTVFISLSKTAETLILNAAKLALLQHKSIYELLHCNPEVIKLQRCTHKQLVKIMKFLREEGITHVYLGVPSDQDNEITYQIAERLRHTPLIVSEYMFRPPATHKIWSHLPKLKQNPHLHWGVPLLPAQIDFDLGLDHTHHNGHLSIDRGIAPITEDIPTIRKELGIAADELLLVMSTVSAKRQDQISDDIAFLQTLLDELIRQPKVQLRLSLHPGIDDLDAYLAQLSDLYTNNGAPSRFQVILQPALYKRLRNPEALHKNNALFLYKNISGSQAVAAADYMSQAVPGGLLNEIAVRGKQVYTQLSPTEPPYLPSECFALSPARFFSAGHRATLTKSSLGLKEGVSAGQACASALLRR